jgi:thiamine-phosphate pyrophosphorylase
LKKSIGKLHVLTDTELQSRFSHLELARLAIEGGADTIQLRQKSGLIREMIEIAQDIKKLCAQTGVPFIVNDRIDVAIASEADGVHLGQDDFPIPLARKLMGKNAIIGGSAVTLKDAQKCLDEGADYVGFGPVYPTSSKPDASSPTGIELMKQAIAMIPLPFIAIGGIDEKNAEEVMQAGAYGIAVISAVCCQSDPKHATRRLLKALGMEK